MKYLVQHIVECDSPEQALSISVKKQDHLITEIVEKPDTYKPTSYCWLDDPNAPMWVLCEGDHHPVADLLG